MIYSSLSLVICLLLVLVSCISYTEAFTFIQCRSKISSTSRISTKLKATNKKDDEDDISSPFFFASVSDGSNSTNSALVAGAGVVGTTAVVLSEGINMIYGLHNC